MKRIILRSFQSPGDVLMLTAAVRDLHRAHPGQFQTDVQTAADAFWENNPNITRRGAIGVIQGISWPSARKWRRAGGRVYGD